MKLTIISPGSFLADARFRKHEPGRPCRLTRLLSGSLLQAAAVVAALQAALAPGGAIAVALSNSGISGVNVTTAPSITGGKNFLGLSL
jgi:hypothetical protein